MVLVNRVLKIVDNGDCKGRNGAVEIYVWGVLTEIGVWKAIMKWQMSRTLSRRMVSAPYNKLESC